MTSVEDTIWSMLFDIDGIASQTINRLGETSALQPQCFQTYNILPTVTRIIITI
jgi:hypothetical protein